MPPEIHSFSNVPVTIEVRIGQRTASVQELASIGNGSIVLLDKPAGETLDLYVGNIRLASVEVVVVDERLAVRITEFESSGIAVAAPAEEVAA